MREVPPYPGAPRWVKVTGIAIAIVIALVVVRHVLGGGLGHGH